MRWGIVATLALALMGCPSDPSDPDGGSTGGGTGGAGGSSSTGGGTGGGSATGGGTGGASGVAGDHCGMVIELPANGGTFSANATAARDDYQGGCALNNQTGGKDLVYHVNLPTPRSVTFSATGLAQVDPVIYVRESPCETGRTLACADGSDVGETEMLFLPYAVGDLYFFIDGWDSSTSGESTVSVSFGTAVPPPANDSCAAAMPLTFVMDRASASGDTTGANNSNALGPDAGPAPSPTCTATAQLYGRDVVYSFTVGQGKNVAVSLSAPDGGLDPAVYVRRSCESTAAADELACNEGAFTLTNLDAGTYYLWVDGLNGTFGAFDLSVSVSDFAPPPPNDVCFSDGGTGATVVPPDGGNVAGTLAGATTHIASSCGAAGSPDVAYTITLGQTSDLVATVSTTDLTMQPVVFIRPDCSTNGFELACAAATAAGRSATATALNLMPGTYAIWVESVTTSAPFTLGVQVRPATGIPANDLCTGAIALSLPQTVTGTTRTAADNASSAFCSSGAGADVFYSVSLAQRSMLTARVTPTEDGGGWLPSVYLRGATGCLGDGGVLGGGSPGCANGGTPGEPAELIVASLDAGTYLLVVDGLSGTRGAFSLDVSASAVAAPAANDTCAMAAPLTFVNGVAEVTASTRATGNNHAAVGGCLGGGPDVVYGFRTPDAGMLDGGTVNLKAVAWSHNPVESSPSVYLQRGCLPDAGSVVCDSSAAIPFLQSRVTTWGARPGTAYSVWIDNVAAEPGGYFTLRVSMADAPPANDACPNAMVLPLNASLAGSTLGAANHFAGTIAADGGFYAGNAACGNALPGADVVYQFTTAQAGSYVVRVQPERGFNAALGVTRACMRGMCLDTVDSAGENLPEQIVVNAMAGTTYFVTVDSASDVPTNAAARGGFVVSVQSP